MSKIDKLIAAIDIHLQNSLLIDTAELLEDLKTQLLADKKALEFYANKSNWYCFPANVDFDKGKEAKTALGIEG